MRITINMPTITATDNQGKIEQIVEYLNNLSQSLNFMCSNIDKDNLSPKLINLLKGDNIDVDKVLETVMSMANTEIKKKMGVIDEVSTKVDELNQKVEAYWQAALGLISTETSNRQSAIAQVRSDYMAADTVVQNNATEVSVALIQAHVREYHS